MITDELLQRVEEIENLSIKCQGSKEENNKFLLKAIKEHAQEIEELFNKNDTHYQKETADMIILCLEFLISNNVNPNDVINIRLNRFIEKIKEICNENI
ncbi:MAG: hypothetical protein J7K26_01950 [Candidatus Aenigmarchaeota archaeon]|nr:hypothetical protein [Candidatus Aenigmarchaeota archaeon]